jgi:hypothetical protein
MCLGEHRPAGCCSIAWWVRRSSVSGKPYIPGGNTYSPVAAAAPGIQKSHALLQASAPRLHQRACVSGHIRRKNGNEFPVSAMARLHDFRSYFVVAAGWGGAGRYPGGGRFAGGILPPSWSRKTRFIPPSCPLRIAATGTLALINFLYWTSSACCFSSAARAIVEFTTKAGHLPVGSKTSVFDERRGGCASKT